MTSQLVVSSLLAFCILVTIPTSARAAIVAKLEEPGNGGYASGIANIRGWAFTTTRGAKLVQPFQIEIDGAPAVQVPCCGDRGDVQAQHPEAPLLTGFSTAFNWGNLPSGDHNVKIIISDSTGASVPLTASFTSFRIGDAQFIQTFEFGNSSECDFGNDPLLGQQATFACSGILLDAATAFGQECVGSIVFGWDRPSQSYKLRSDCE